VTLIFILNCVDTQLTALLSIVQAEITPVAFTQPQPSTQEMNDEHADVPGNRRDR